MPLEWIDFNQQLFCCAKYLPCHSAPAIPLWLELWNFIQKLTCHLLSKEYGNIGHFLSFSVVIRALDKKSVNAVERLKECRQLRPLTPPVNLYLIFEKSSSKNQVRQTGFLACKNQFRN